MRILPLTLAIAFLLPGCATGWHATLSDTVPPKVRTAIEDGPIFETVFHTEAAVYRIPVSHLAAERDAVWRALLEAPVVPPAGFRDVGIDWHDRVVVRERWQLLSFDSPQLSVVRTGEVYRLDLVDADDADHHYLVEFEPTSGLDRAWRELARSAKFAAAMPPVDRPTRYTLVDDSDPAHR
jgi:hypothetical protein